MGIVIKRGEIIIKIKLKLFFIIYIMNSVFYWLNWFFIFWWWKLCIILYNCIYIDIMLEIYNDISMLDIFIKE